MRPVLPGRGDGRWRRLRLGSERAATLLGAAAALQEQQGNAWPPDEAPHFERSRAAVTEALDHDQLEWAWSAGQRMPLVSWKRHWAMQVE
jgi:hypothetical protein